jgi:hypothetical protein
MFRLLGAMTSATIKLFLPRGDAKSLRTAEIAKFERAPFSINEGP